MSSPDHLRARQALDDADRARQAISTVVHELIRRGSIPVGADGWPRSASGADRGSVSAGGRRVEAIEVWPLSQTEWAWRCSCGEDLSTVLPRGDDSYSSSHTALSAGEVHLHASHGSARSIDYADPTGDAAVSAPPVDPLGRLTSSVLRRLDSWAREAQAIAAAITTALGERPVPTTLEDPGCASCSRLPTWTPTHLSGDVGGRLHERKRLCSWCYKHVLATERLPTRPELVAHYEGRRVRKSA